MGASRSRREAFFRDHPWCCFCGGGARATTVDHIPARTCFLGRASPETFEFPACSRCQNASRLDELIFAFYVRLTDFNEANFDSDELADMIRGVLNNAPHALPKHFQSSRHKRTVWREMGLVKPFNTLASDLPVLSFPPTAHPHIVRYVCKISTGIYYREKGRIAPHDSLIWSSWAQSVNPATRSVLELILEKLPLLTVGARTNRDFGDQFAYRFNQADHPDVMGITGQFGRGVVFTSFIIDAPSLPLIGDGPDWTPIPEAFIAPPPSSTSIHTAEALEQRHGSASS